MLDKNKVIEFTATPSFCNFWPELRVEINNVVVWQGTVDHVQRFCFPVEFEDSNQVRIHYINKRNGPDAWDTVIDQDGKILQDQNCVISEISIGKSRCDFLPSELMFVSKDGTNVQSFGFLSQQGYLLIEFPRDVYDWILTKRQSQILRTTTRSSSLDYWTNYIIDHSDVDQEIINDIKKLLANDPNTSN